MAKPLPIELFIEELNHVTGGAVTNGATTLAVGEEGGSPDGGRITTLAVGEEGGSSGPSITTAAVGEEGGSAPFFK